MVYGIESQGYCVEGFARRYINAKLHNQEAESDWRKQEAEWTDRSTLQLPAFGGLMRLLADRVVG